MLPDALFAGYLAIRREREAPYSLSGESEGACMGQPQGARSYGMFMVKMALNLPSWFILVYDVYEVMGPANRTAAVCGRRK